MPIPNYESEVKAAIQQYPDAFAHAHVEGDPRRYDFIKLLARDLHAIDPHVALNGKRGDPDNLSMDALNILCTSAESDGRTPDNRPCVVVDVIAHAGAKPPYSGTNPAPTAAWNVYKSKVEGSGAHVDPAAQPPDPPPSTPAAITFPPRDVVGRFFEDLDRYYRDGGRPNRAGFGAQLHVDNEGLFVWLSEFMRHYAIDHPTASIDDRAQAARDATLEDIAKAWR